MKWLIIILIAAVVCGIIGFFVSDEGERGEGAIQGAFAGAWGCGTIIIRIVIGIAIFSLLIRFVSWLFN